MSAAPTQPDFSSLLVAQHDFSACVKLAVGSKDTQAPRVDLLFLRFKESIPDEHGLAETICHQVVNYAIPKRKIEELLAKSGTSGSDFSWHSKLLAEAKRAFVSYKSDNSKPNANLRYGEIGELISFCIASHFLQAGQVAAKMALKTNSQMLVFGLDGIHVRAETDGNIAVYFLESKIVGNAVDGGTQYAKSAATFDTDRKHKLNEQRIARDLSNLDIFEGQMRDVALEYFDPYSQAQSNVRERFVGIIVYTEPIYNDKLAVTDATPLIAHENNFVSKYLNQHTTFTNDLEKALKSKGAEPGRCRAFYLAVPDSDKLKELFAKEMTGDHIR